jgi:hypothetical protein
LLASTIRAGATAGATKNPRAKEPWVGEGQVYRHWLNMMWGYLEPKHCRLRDFRALFLAFNQRVLKMAGKKLGYRVTVAGPGHNFDRTIDEATASQILAIVMTGAAPASGGTAGARHGAGGGASTPPGAASPQGSAKNMSLAAYIKAKKGEKNQITRFLATASWLSDRSSDPVTATAVAKALSDHHQKRLANPADALNKNVTKGHAEKRKDGSFFITPEGIEALEGSTAE